MSVRARFPVSTSAVALAAATLAGCAAHRAEHPRHGSIKDPVMGAPAPVQVKVAAAAPQPQTVRVKRTVDAPAPVMKVSVEPSSTLPTPAMAVAPPVPRPVAPVAGTAPPPQSPPAIAAPAIAAPAVAAPALPPRPKPAAVAGQPEPDSKPNTAAVTASARPDASETKLAPERATTDLRRSDAPVAQTPPLMMPAPAPAPVAAVNEPPKSEPAIRIAALSEIQRVKSTLARAQDYLAANRISDARTLLEEAAKSGSQEILFALAETWDPLYLRQANPRLARAGDPVRAIAVYEAARARGAANTDARIDALKALPR